MAIGPNDLSGGIDFLLKSVADGIPWVSGNILTTEDTLVFPPWKVLETQNGLVGIVGLTSYTATPQENIEIADWRNVLPLYIDELSGRCDLLILLSNLSDTENAAITAQFPEIHILISANSKSGNVSPQLHNNTLRTQTHSKGKYLGILKVEWPNSRLWENTPELTRENLTILKRNLQDRITRNSKESHASGENMNRSTTKNAQIDANEMTPEINLKQFGTYSYRFRVLSDDVPDSEDILGDVNDLKSKISVINKKKTKTPNISFKSNQLHLLQTLQNFAGASDCKTCHGKQYSKWLQSRHSNAYTTLSEKKQQYNLRCLPCHVTHPMNNDNSEADNSFLISLPKNFQGVGCESCHGPGQEHVKSDGQVTTFKTVDADVCLPCHTTQMDHTFSFESAVNEICNKVIR